MLSRTARHAAAALKTGFRNKTDKNDPRGIADLMRVNKFGGVCLPGWSPCGKKPGLPVITIPAG
jgi:hypothetical protein